MAWWTPNTVNPNALSCNLDDQSQAHIQTAVNSESHLNLSEYINPISDADLFVALQMHPNFPITQVFGQWGPSIGPFDLSAPVPWQDVQLTF
ncbi:hypothetical protein N7532_009457 [Penicillium argentinense]|uniref:Uncharacterized protein n=1 Tax=Penicillium argentinense TaxID=1131581 RepID=A0A9W9EZC2_9EURO|nr:uncharacterized protein N7532_009457 [Penicillium argentinense]KAJ5090773.1 hypothetical protein N7532_009457 [Penicillium argentinense]